MRRRDVVLAGLGLGALGLSEALRPRHRLVLLRSGTIEAAVPRQFGPWSSEITDLVNPEQAGRLAKSLYSEIVQRTYYRQGSDAAVMMLIAYGDTQSDLLQLHRPESCYPAVGYNIELTQPEAIGIGGGATLPGRRVVATMEGRRENILYWTRLGERLPQSGGEQRRARLENAIEGYVPDGALVRFSVAGDSAPSFSLLRQFVPDLLKVMPHDKVPALVGSKLARSVA